LFGLLIRDAIIRHARETIFRAQLGHRRILVTKLVGQEKQISNMSLKKIDVRSRLSVWVKDVLSQVMKEGLSVWVKGVLSQVMQEGLSVWVKGVLSQVMKEGLSLWVKGVLSQVMKEGLSVWVKGILSQVMKGFLFGLKAS
jgi:hypothetical protein